MYYDQIKLLKQGVEKARGLLGDAIDVVPGLGTVNQGLLAAENIGRGNLAGAAENIQNLVPTGKIAGRAIKALTKGKGQSEVAGVLNIDAPKYQGSHRAPYKDDEGFNAPLSALDKLYPSDVYSPKAIQYYGAGQPGEREALRVAAQVRNNPSAKVKMYRAVPKGVDAADINPGDWVTLSKDYAKYHGDAVLGGDYKILSKEVPAGSLYTNADSLNEFGYDPTGFGIQGGLLGSNTGDVVPGLGANSAKEIEQSWSARGINGSISENGNKITVNKIIVPKEMRGSGLGTQAMNDLLSYADATGKTIALTPSADFGGQKSRLDKFYKGLGFEQNKGRSRDFEISESMLRKPKALGIQGGLLDSNTDTSLLNRYQAPQDEALALAQKRAALPVSEGGLGLPPDNTPMQRAKAGGFVVPIYHGTSDDIQAFDVDMAGKNTMHASADVPAVWASGSPSVANIFASQRVTDATPIAQYGPRGAGLKAIRTAGLKEGGNVMPLLMRGQPDQTLKAGEAQRMIFGEPGGDWRDAGQDFADFFNKNPVLTKIKGHPMADLEFRADQYVIPDPSVVRSRFAAFDPFRFGENDLLAIQGGLLGTSQDSSILNRYETDADRRMEIARRNAALPVEQGGLGLPENNTPMDRARAMGFSLPQVHFSRHGADVSELDSGKFAIAPFDAVGTHVGSADAAMDRFKTTVGTSSEPKGASYPLMVKTGEQFVSPKTGGAWSETELLDALWERGGYATSGETLQSLNPKLRRDIFKGSGYDSIPYVNDVEAKGEVSNIVPPWNIRSRFAAFDPMRRNESDLLALQGGQYTPQDLLGFERMMGLLGE